MKKIPYHIYVTILLFTITYIQLQLLKSNFQWNFNSDKNPDNSKKKKLLYYFPIIPIFVSNIPI